MKSPKIISILFLIIMCLYLYRCKPEEIILHGEISGLVTDTITSQPLQAVAVKLDPLNDTTSTASDGKYLFKSLIPGDYKIEVSKPPYAKEIKKAKVTSANTKEVNFALHQIQYPEISNRHLDFGFDSTQKSFTITNTGIGKLHYTIAQTQDWITVNPNIGDITSEPQTINVTVNRTGLTVKKHIESIEIDSYVGLDIIRDTVYVLLNGIMDQDYNYYNVVTIGTQTWMAENLNVGKKIVMGQEQQDNGTMEKWCYDCKTYGGLYTWNEMMQYNPSDSGIIGTTQGICPVGWHIPTTNEWFVLIDYVGGRSVAGEKLKETGTVHFKAPNDATDEYGFTALPGGQTARRGEDTYSTNPSSPGDNIFVLQGTTVVIWSSYLHPPSWLDPEYALMHWAEEAETFNTSTELTLAASLAWWGCSVRCVKDPPKNK